MKVSTYYLYILKCVDDTLYTGITTDVVRRVNEHNTSLRAAKYTSLRRPVVLVYWKECATRSDAIKEELKIKKLPRLKKILLTESTKLKAPILRQKASKRTIKK